MEGQSNFGLKRTHPNAFCLLSIMRYFLIRLISYETFLLDALACGFTVRCTIYHLDLKCEVVVSREISGSGCCCFLIT